MRRQTNWMPLAAMSLALCLGAAARGDERIRFVHSFAAAAGGWNPNAVVAHQTSADLASWALYGSTYAGGAGNGVVYKLAPPLAGDSHWTEARLYVFQDESDGLNPNGPLLFDSSGNAYGVTEQGGSASGAVAYGTVFQLAPPKPGRYFWNKTILHAFAAGPDGAFPYGRLTAGKSGALYGVSRYLDANAPWRGAVFQLTPPTTGHGAWTFTILHAFYTGGVGGQVGTPLVTDPSGALYGITDGDPPNECPRLYKLSPAVVGGAWSFSTPYSFSCQKRGYNSLLRDPAGNFYGTRVYPGSGEVFQLRPPAAGQTVWTEAVLHTFNGPDGDFPTELSRIDDSGSIYGATADRLSAANALIGGVVFRLDPPPGDASPWGYTTIAVTSQNYQTSPSGLLARDPSGALYTSMFSGGPLASDTSTQGAVFRIAR